MDRELEARAAEIFAEALELGVEQRPQFLRARCRFDAQLQARVESLLRAHPKGAALLRSPVLQEQIRDATEDFIDRHLGQEIGSYRLTRLLASGGMGRVYLGERRGADFDQRIAIKLLHPGMDSANVLRRFRMERRLLAGLEHPNIARLIDGGSTPDGEPYLVMEYVDGVPIDRYCDAKQMRLDDRLDLFCTVCAAVQYAHDKHVVHRDLKPGNLMVDRTGQVKLLDFGIAKVLDSEALGEITATVHRAMTPRYASPEQLRGERVTTASDVYSLGVLLYELLTGQSPYRSTRTTSPEFVRLVTEFEPAPPSAVVTRPIKSPGDSEERGEDAEARLSSPVSGENGDDAASESSPAVASALRGTTPRKLAQQLFGDLDTIVLKALRKEPDRRYESAEDLANDIHRYRAGLPVLARPDTLRYRVTKLARRNRALAAGVAVAFAALSLGLAGSLIEYRRALQSRNEAEWLAYQSSISAAESSIRTNRLAEARWQLEAAPAKMRGWEWRHLDARLDHSLLRIPAHEAAVTAVRFTPDGERIVSTSEDRTVRVWDARTGAALARSDLLQGVPRTLAVDATGSLTAVGLEEGHVQVLDLRSGHPVTTFVDPVRKPYMRPTAAFEADSQIALLDRPSTWASVDFHPNGRWLATGFYSGAIRLWDLETHGAIASWSFEDPGCKRMVRFRPDGMLFATASEYTPVRLWDPTKNRLVRELGGQIGAVDLCFDSAGDRLAACFQDQSIEVWDVDSGRKITSLRGHGGSIRALEFDSTGEVLVSSATDGQVAAWDLATGTRRWIYPGHTANVHCVARNPDGSRLVTGDWDGNLRVWRFETEDVRTLVVMKASFRRHWAEDASMTPDGGRLVTSTIELASNIWDLVEGRKLAQIDIDRRPDQSMGKLSCVAWMRDGNRIVAGLGLGWIAIQDADSARTVRHFQGHSDNVCAIDARPERAQFVTGARDSTLKIWDIDSERPIHVLLGHRGGILAARYSPDGRQIASGSEDGTIRLWDADTGEMRGSMQGHRGPVRQVAFSLDGMRLASASFDGTVRLWDVRKAAPIATLLDTGRQMYAVAFTHDGTRLAAGGMDGIVRLLDPAAGREVARLYGHDDRIFWLAFAPEDRALISTSLDGTIRIWDAIPRRTQGT